MIMMVAFSITFTLFPLNLISLSKIFEEANTSANNFKSEEVKLDDGKMAELNPQWWRRCYNSRWMARVINEDCLTTIGSKDTIVLGRQWLPDARYGHQSSETLSLRFTKKEIEVSILPISDRILGESAITFPQYHFETFKISNNYFNLMHPEQRIKG